MKTAAIAGVRDGGIVERPDPIPGGAFVRVKVTVAPMCTEYKAYAAGHVTDRLGHEAAGIVDAVGRPGPVKPGDRVVAMPTSPCGTCPLCLSGDYIHCQQGVDPLAATGSLSGTATYAQYLLKNEALLLPIPDDLSDERASLACCGLGPTFGAMQRMAVDALDTVLITGLGPVGMGGVVNASVRGARVIAVESHPYRAARARELGAAEVLSPDDPDAVARIRDLTEGRGADKAIDCSGAAAAQRLLIEAVRRRGQVAFVGEGGEVPVHVSNDMIRKGLTLHGIWHWNRQDAPRMWRTIRRAGPLLDRLVTHRFPLSAVRDAWELQLTGNCGKVLLDPWR